MKSTIVILSLLFSLTVNSQTLKAKLISDTEVELTIENPEEKCFFYTNISRKFALL